jgi:ribonuclease T1
VLRTRRPLLALLLLGVLLAGGYLLSAVRSGDSAPSGSATGAESAGPGSSSVGPGRSAHGLPRVRSADLPPEARSVLRLIDAGGPFRYAQDGTAFGNVEGLLPTHLRGWYREYTVPTPGERDRGARRIIAGQDGARFYAADHYESFARIEDP